MDERHPSAWGIPAGYTPALSIEIVPGEYRCGVRVATAMTIPGGHITLRQVRDFKGQELIDGVLALVDHPLHVQSSRELLVRYRELDTLPSDPRAAAFTSSS